MSRAGRLPARWQVAWVRLLCLFLDHVLLSTRVVGQQHLPRRGGVILAGNHTGLVDGPVVLGASPRGAHFIMKYSLGQGLGGRILRAGGQVPVDQNNGRQALKTCLGLLERGQVVGIFPEGARGDGSMSEIKAGVAWLAVNSRAPVVPFACLGTRHEGEAITKMPRLRRKIYVSFGAPVELDLDREAPAREQVAAALEQIGAAMRVQVERAVAASGIPLPQDTGRETKDD